MGNSDIDLENKTLTVRQGVKEIFRRDGVKSAGGTEIKIGKPKSATSKRTVPLNSAALESVRDLRDESYFGENTPPYMRRERGLYKAGQSEKKILSHT